MQSQLRFNRVPEKVPEKVGEALEHAEVFPAFGFAARFRKICKNKKLRLPPKLRLFCGGEVKSLKTSVKLPKQVTTNININHCGQVLEGACNDNSFLRQ